MAENTNVSSLINPDIAKNLSKSVQPKAFGEQIINDKKETLKQSSLTKKESLKKDIQNNIEKSQKLEVNHALNLQNLYDQYSPPPPIKPTLTLEEYQNLVNVENNNYQEEKLKLEEERVLLQQKLVDILKDPYKQIKDTKFKLKLKINLKIKRNKNKENKEKKRLTTKVLKSAFKSVVPLLSLQGTKLVFNLISNNKKLQDLVDNTNAIIEAATTKEAINNARVVRNSTLSILNDNERKLVSLQKLIRTLNRIVTVLNIILQLSRVILPIPTPPGAVPDVVTPRKERFRARYEKAVKIVEGLNVVISILQGIVDSQLETLRDLKNQLRNLNQLIDNAAVNTLTPGDLSNNIQFDDYKGFKLRIKEEETLGAQQAVVVRGTIKRRYAVAIDRDGVEVLKSEFSFTLDPQDLVEQLKLIIDQQNLQA